MLTKQLPLSGWGRHPVIPCEVVRPGKSSALAALCADETPRIARGAGRSYGDAAVSASGLTVLTGRLNRMLFFDEATGTLRAESGVTLAEILEVFVPRGWFLPVTPGTRHVMLGGAVAFDVHGKNHHCDGSFGHFVSSFELLMATGECCHCSRTEHSDLFFATLGGAGLTGFITEVTLSLRPIETAYIRETRYRARNLDEALHLFDTHEADFPYSVAWIDCLARGASLGRSVLLFGRHAGPDELDDRARTHPLVLPGHKARNVPFDFPAIALNRLSMRLFNALYFRTHGDGAHLLPYDTYFYPLDAVRNWNRIYGRRGFVQFQCVLPPDRSREALIELLTRSSRAGRGSFLAVLKRFGPSSGGMLSFPMPGYTLAMDLPVRSGLDAFLDDLTGIVLAAGGRIYLAKDAHLDPETFRAMYPAFPSWMAIKERVDPDHRFASALSRRLGITPERYPEAV